MWRVVSSEIGVPLCKTRKEAVVLEQGPTVIVHKTSMKQFYFACRFQTGQPLKEKNCLPRSKLYSLRVSPMLCPKEFMFPFVKLEKRQWC